jgi:hypothetical protein
LEIKNPKSKEEQMSNHHHKNKTDQVCSKEHGAASSHCEKMPCHPGEPMESEDIQTKLSADDRSIRLRAHQIYLEKGGSALDNWLEAERASR